MSKIQILVIDDDLQFCSLMQEVLSAAGYQVQTALDGRRGFQLASDNPVDLVVIDLLMPGKDGLETIQHILKEKPDLKVIAISGGRRGGALDFMSAAAKLGAARTFYKPFDHHDFLDAVQQLTLGAARPT